MSAKADAVTRLSAADAELFPNGRLWSLDPSRERANDLGTIGLEQLGDDDAPAVALAFADVLVSIVRAQREHFPSDVFADLDFLAAASLRVARGTEGIARVAGLRDRLVDLYAAFGRHSPIRFRYGHDFAYGFDWERWVARDPGSRAGIGPYDVSFLAHMRERGREIAAAVRHGHPRYPLLADDAWRNPFPFSRAPEHEEKLLRDLAARNAIPIKAWRADLPPDWRVGASSLRVERASALGIPPSSAHST